MFSVIQTTDENKALCIEKGNAKMGTNKEDGLLPLGHKLWNPPSPENF